MKFVLSVAAIIIAAFGVAQAEQEEILATPLRRSPPPYPEACIPLIGQNAEPQQVVLMFDLDRDGAVENVRVRESTDPCFEDVAVASAHSWSYKPRIVNGVRSSQEDVEVTVTFELDEDTQAEEYDARPMLRVPPKYPEFCMSTASDKETVLVQFDVTKEGRTENISVPETTHKCLNNAAMDAVKGWRYRPKIVKGEAAARRGVQTVITFELSNGGSLPEAMKVRYSVSRTLMKAQKLAQKKGKPDAALALMEELHSENAGSFSQRELSAFHQVRAIVRLQLEDYRGALDDLRMVQRLGASDFEQQGEIAKIIVQIEQKIDADEAAARAAVNEEQATAKAK